MTKNDVLIINGRRYDSETGQPLVTDGQHDSKSRSMDGVMTTKKLKSVKQPSVTKNYTGLSKPVETNSNRISRAHDIILSKTIHAPKTTKPLMRTGLKKPSKITKLQKNSQAASAPQRLTADIKFHHNSARMQRAESMHRIDQVKHFSKHHSSESRRWGVNSSLLPTVAATSKIIDSVATQTNKLQAIIDKGLEKASSHDQPEPSNAKRKNKSKKSKSKHFNITVCVLAVLFILGFVLHKSIPYIDVRIASMQSGVNAKIPGFIPSGFKFQGPIRYGQGTVTITFTSGNRSFRITQQNSNWDSLSLRDSFVKTSNTNYKVVQAGGRIVYLYGQADETWVNTGIWYQISDNANLSTTNLLKIVTSL